MPNYTTITIIYNPKSTGNGLQLAKELKDKLAEQEPKSDVSLVATKHAGHAEELAYEHAMASKRPLIISASGDGGYHEVINGVLKAKKDGANAVTGLLPAGNANDHYNELHDTDIVKSIVEHREQLIDILSLSTKIDNKQLQRYGHSYIGLGLTPEAGRELNKTQLNWINQITIVLRVLLFLRPVAISVAGKTRHYDSLIFSNISTTSKVLTIAKESSANDGQFEVTSFRRRNKLKLISSLLHSSTIGLKGGEKMNQYTFNTIKPTLVQIDGEIITIDANTKTQISIEHQALTCII